tara:strand:- start:323 stop:466 length:144 start_codon:yes stop_codon:yes gene_type:complete
MMDGIASCVVTPDKTGLMMPPSDILIAHVVFWTIAMLLLYLLNIIPI